MIRIWSSARRSYSASTSRRELATANAAVASRRPAFDRLIREQRAGGPVRAVVQACGIPNVLTKSIGSHNPHNVVKATINALEQLRDRAAVREMRGLSPEKV